MAKSSGFVPKIKPRPQCHMFDVKVDHDFEVDLRCNEKLMSSKTRLVGLLSYGSTVEIEGHQRKN